jgi:sodium/pantothenate symporter
MYAASSQVWFAFAVYLLITFGLAHLAHRRRGGGGFLEDYFVAGRELGPWVLAFTWTATMASGGTFIGTPALAHTYGWPVMLWICSYMVVATVGMGVLGKRVAEIGRRTGALTFPDLLRDRFESKAIGMISGVAILILYTAYVVAQYIAGARVIEAVLGVPYLWGVFGFAITVGLYTVYGGFRAVAWTDSFQAMVMLFGVLLTAFFAIRKVGGLEAVFANLEAQSPEMLSLPGPDGFLPLPAAISFFCIWALATAGQPSLVTRFLACRDSASIKRASFLIGLYILLLYPAIITIGIVGRVLTPELQAADHAMPATILAAVPPLLAGFVLAAPLAAIMSSISSFLLVSSSAIVRDLYQRNLERPLSDEKARLWSHVATVAVTVVALTLALRPPEFLQYIVVFSGTGLAATFLLPTLFAIYWPRMNAAGCLAGMIGGFGSFVAQYLSFGTKSFGGFDPFVWALLASLVCSVVVTMLSPPPSRELTLRYFGGGAG